MDETRLENLIDLIGKFEHAMLVTMTEARELRSRPMAIADCTDAARLWFITSNDSGKLAELTEFPNVNVAMQDGSHFLSISGTARTSKDRARITELWSEEHEAWFEGPDDPEVILLEIVPTYAEYWDGSGLQAVKILAETAKAVLTGEEPSFDDDVHAKLRFPGKQLGK